ncbi:MAG TPA: aminotransferase class III-fold pyridoxal phosphate-dependent enzyme [Actinomycetota bacterium]|nr:aminotransferase class III-fold pyridoxal phosphate-dependent enzyme [Actinomycetota bacterium]
MTAVFPRVMDRPLPTVALAHGASIWDVNGNRYLDASGGALVVGVGHGDADVVRAMVEQASRVAYVHGTQFTSEALEAYASELALLLPMELPKIYPVSGGSEAMETALKLARSYHLARGEDSRYKIIARVGSYHGNSLGALDASGRGPLRRPYRPWLGRAKHVPRVYEYRCPLPTHPDFCGERHAEILEEAFRKEGPKTVACFVAEPIVGATLGAAVPPDDYWSNIQQVCRDYGVLLIADEVMTGFGRTGRWFGSDHWNVRPDILIAGKAASSGYWPLGLVACSGQVFETIERPGFVHGFTFSHSPVGAAVGRAVLRKMKEQDLVEASRVKGERLLKELTQALSLHPHVGDVRGLGLMIGIELVEDEHTRMPFERRERISERVVGAAMEEGLILYLATGSADGINGDVVMLGPPYVITDEEITEAVDKTRAAIDRVFSR